MELLELPELLETMDLMEEMVFLDVKVPVVKMVCLVNQNGRRVVNEVNLAKMARMVNQEKEVKMESMDAQVWMDLQD